MKKTLCLLAILALWCGNHALAIQDTNVKPLKGKAARNAAQGQEMTLGLVQRDVKTGATMDEVALALGSPNIVTRDAEGKDTWIYDKISRVTTYSESGMSTGLIPSLFVVGGRGRGSHQSEQKTLTVVIKFGKDSRVESFNYHMSKF
jgi:outer membrane protein assembly factor BamE (lipoprotein component of BamABCDE complex)